MDRAPWILTKTVVFVLGALGLLTGVAWGDPSGAANVPQILSVGTFQGVPATNTQQRTFLTTDVITAGATFYDPNPACIGMAPPVHILYFFNLEGQLLLTREDVTSIQIAPGSKYQALALSLAPATLGAGSYNLVFETTDCTHTNIFVSGFYQIRVLNP